MHIVGVKEPSEGRQEHLQKKLAKAHAGDQLAETDSQHEQRNAAGNMVGVGQYKRDDQRVGDNGRDRAQEAVLPKRVGAKGAEQGRESAENNIGQRAAGQYIAQKASKRQAGDGSGSQEGQDRECLRKADLYGSAREIESRGDHGQDRIKCGDQGRLGDVNGFL